MIDVMTTFRVVTIREINSSECPWVKQAIPAGTILELRSDPYGCCSASGVSVGFTGLENYFELPEDALVGINEEASVPRD